jgi:hypothetical protein
MAENTNLGCPILAMAASKIEPLNGHWDDYDNWVEPAKTQTLFEELGSGSYRIAYRGPDGNVYKVENFDTENANWDEAEFFAGHADANWIPQYHYDAQSNVMVMREYPHPSGGDFVSTPEDSKKERARKRENTKRQAEIDNLTNDGKIRNLGLDENGLVVLLDGNYNVDTWDDE